LDPQQFNDRRPEHLVSYVSLETRAEQCDYRDHIIILAHGNYPWQMPVRDRTPTDVKMNRARPRARYLTPLLTLEAENVVRSQSRTIIGPCSL
jgi:hypothetical protein